MIREVKFVLFSLLVQFALVGFGSNPPKASAGMPFSLEPVTVETQVMTLHTEPTYNYNDYTDEYGDFKLKTPALGKEQQLGLNYVIENNNKSSIVISHYNAAEDEGAYDLEMFDTAGSALLELLDGKATEALSEKYGLSVDGCSIISKEKPINSHPAVRFTGTFEVSNNSKCGAVGYSVLTNTGPVVFFGVDLSNDQSNIDDLSIMVDGMAGSFVDATEAALGLR